MAAEKITEINGKGIVIRGNDIDTDRIIPARFLREITFENMGKYAFYDQRFDENENKKNHPFNDEKYKNASILIVNKNFGCGSSREHAPQALMRWGIRAIIGESFADIFAGNCGMIGLPVASASKEDITRVMDFIERNPEGEIIVDIKNMEVLYGSSKIKISISESMRKSLVEGTWDLTSMMLEEKDRINAVMSKLPYLNNFD
ncbi:MAG: 3-isopropylmalate dehydratase small subunit [Nanoarchaeota archaeon]|nr:3-isopropylmalate dehydratase small subunit [Nanoarchaeota archaeon]